MFEPSAFIFSSCSRIHSSGDFTSLNLSRRRWQSGQDYMSSVNRFLVCLQIPSFILDQMGSTKSFWGRVVIMQKWWSLTSSAGPYLVERNFLFMLKAGLGASFFYYSGKGRGYSGFGPQFFSILLFIFCSLLICLSFFISLSSAKVGPLSTASWSSRLTCLQASRMSNSLDLHSINAKIKQRSSVQSLQPNAMSISPKFLGIQLALVNTSIFLLLYFQFLYDLSRQIKQGIISCMTFSQNCEPVLTLSLPIFESASTQALKQGSKISLTLMYQWQAQHLFTASLRTAISFYASSILMMQFCCSRFSYSQKLYQSPCLARRPSTMDFTIGPFGSLNRYRLDINLALASSILTSSEYSLQGMKNLCFMKISLMWVEAVCLNGWRTLLISSSLCSSQARTFLAHSPLGPIQLLRKLMQKVKKRSQSSRDSLRQTPTFGFSSRMRKNSRLLLSNLAVSCSYSSLVIYWQPSWAQSFSILASYQSIQKNNSQGLGCRLALRRCRRDCTFFANSLCLQSKLQYCSLQLGSCSQLPMSMGVNLSSWMRSVLSLKSAKRLRRYSLLSSEANPLLDLLSWLGLGGCQESAG